MLLDTYRDHDADGEGADRCALCPTIAHLRGEITDARATIARLAGDLARAHGLTISEASVRYGVEVRG